MLTIIDLSPGEECDRAGADPHAGPEHHRPEQGGPRPSQDQARLARQLTWRNQREGISVFWSLPLKWFVMCWKLDGNNMLRLFTLVDY
jgi:hypothetical protein